MPFVLRNEDDTSNPVAARLYGKGITAARLMYYRKNWQDARTAFISILSEGARKYGDEGCDGIEHVYYAGFELPEFDSTGARNWKFHPGNMTAREVHKQVTAVNTSTNELTVAAHGYVTGTAVEAFSQGTIPAPLVEGTTYFAVNISTNILKLATDQAGTNIVDITSAGSGNIFVFANANVGFKDPVQGASFFFPGLKWTGSGLAWIEVLLPADLSDGEDEPSRLKVVMRGKRVRSYTRTGNALVPGSYVYSTNNALCLLDIYTIDMKRPLSRFHAVTWVDEFLPRCDAMLAWAGGNEGTDTFAWQAVSNFSVDSLGGLTKTSANAWNARAASIAFPAGTKIKAQVRSASGTWGIGFSTSQTGGPTPDDLIFSIQPNSPSQQITQKGSGVTNVMGDWGFGDSFEIAIEDDGAGGLKFTAHQNGNALPLTSVPAVPNATLYVNFLGFTINGGITQATITPAGTIASPRSVKRFTASVVFSSLTQASAAADAIWFRAPGCHAQDVNGVIKVLSTPARTPFARKLIYDPSSANASNVLNFKTYYRPADQKSNFYSYTFRNEDDPFLRKGLPVFVDRPLLRKLYGLRDAGAVPLGVMTQSLAERIGECYARLDADLEPFYVIDASFDMYGLAKGDFVPVAEITAGTSDADPALAMVISEILRFPEDGVETKQFICQAISDDFYSDTDHGAIVAKLPSNVISPFLKPPALADLELSYEPAQFADGTITLSLKGLATFTPFAQQRARVEWQRPTDVDFTPTGIILTPKQPDQVDSFILPNAALGEHKVRVTTETMSGVTSLTSTIATLIVAPPPTTALMIFDNVPPRESEIGLGVTVGIRRSGAGTFFGASLQRERGYGYEPVGTLTKQAVIGRSTNNGDVWLAATAGKIYFTVENSDEVVLTAATLAEITAGKNNFFIGREKIGVQTPTYLGSNVWKGENLVRGLNHTEIFQGTHTAAEDVILLDENIYFIPIERRDMNTTLLFKAVSFGLTLGVVAAVSLACRGDSVRSYAVSNLLSTHDTNNSEWHTAADGNPRVNEQPETYVARFRKASTGALLRDVPINPHIHVAALFTAPSGAIDISANNVYGTSDFGASGSAHTIQELNQVGSEVSARITVPQEAVSSPSAYASLTLGTSGWSVFFSKWSATETFVTSTNFHGEGDGGGGLIVPSVGGVVYLRVALVGTELRLTVSGSPIESESQPPSIVFNDTPAFPTPSYVFVEVRGSETAIENVQVSGLHRPQTIYRLLQQEDDNSGSGIASGDLDVEFWQVSPSNPPDFKGFPVRKTF